MLLISNGYLNHEILLNTSETIAKKSEYCYVNVNLSHYNLSHYVDLSHYIEKYLLQLLLITTKGRLILNFSVEDTTIGLQYYFTQILKLLVKVKIYLPIF